jgi:hypothetical protein
MKFLYIDDVLEKKSIVVFSFSSREKNIYIYIYIYIYMLQHLPDKADLLDKSMIIIHCKCLKSAPNVQGLYKPNHSK